MKTSTKDYDYLIVGAGLFGAVFAYLQSQKGKKCLVIDKRDHIGGNIYCEEIEGINVHKYGPHIFHTDKKYIWDFVNSLVEFNHFRYTPLAYYKGEYYNLPFNMHTFYQMWGAATPMEAKQIINEQVEKFGCEVPGNLEEQALSLVGKDLYQKLIKGYTEKQWGMDATHVPAFIIKRIPLRFIYDNNYFDDPYQGIPIGGYNKLINKLLDGIDVRLNVEFLENKSYFELIADKILYTGCIDEFYGFTYGQLDYRSLRFETTLHECSNYQGNAAVNYTDREIPYTRIIEHKHFEFGNQENTVITKEFSTDFTKKDNEPFYPINDHKNNEVYNKYRALSEQQSKYIFGGRLGSYKYFDMDDTIEAAMQLDMELEKKLTKEICNL